MRNSPLLAAALVGSALVPPAYAQSGASDGVIGDLFASNGRIREDGRLIKDIYLVQVKAPTESKPDWDYFNVRATIPGSEAFLPIEQSVCPLVKKG